MDIDIGSFVSSFLKNGCFASSWSHEKHHVLICLKGYSKPFQNGQWFTVLQAILGPMSFTQRNGLSRSEMVVHAFFMLFHVFFHAMRRPTSQFIYLLSHSCLPIGNLIPSIHWLPNQEERVHDYHDRFHLWRCQYNAIDSDWLRWK
jgi:hypothetical protein